MTNHILTLLVLLLLSGFFSSAEIALFSISQTRARHIAKSDRKTDKLIGKMKADPHQLLTTVLIGNNVVNVAAASLATSLTINLFPDYAVGVATGIMTFLILVFGEVFPKSLATRNNLLIARIAIYPVYWLSILFFPIVMFLNFIPKITGRLRKTPTVTEEELKTFVDVVEEKGEIKEEEKEFIHNIFEFDDTNASEIMTPRADMFVLEEDKPIDLQSVVNSGFSRIPIISNGIDDVIGIMYIKDLLLHLSTSDAVPEAKNIKRNPYFVPENMKLDKLFHQFKKRKNHMAIIVDEHGGVSGLITLEDVLEEIVGEISDETDRIEQYIVKLGKNEWRVLGKSDIDEVNEAIPMSIQDTGEYDTFSGYILNVIGRIPDVNEEITMGNFTVIVKEMDGNRIKEYIIRQEQT